jgi:hypothetical protein
LKRELCPMAFARCIIRPNHDSSGTVLRMPAPIGSTDTPRRQRIVRRRYRTPLSRSGASYRANPNWLRKRLATRAALATTSKRFAWTWSRSHGAAWGRLTMVRQVRGLRGRVAEGAIGNWRTVVAD